MKKLKFTHQLLLLFTFLMGISCFLFALLVFSKVNNLTKAQVYERLESYIAITSSEWEKGEFVTPSEELPIGIVQGWIIDDESAVVSYTNKSEKLDRFINKEETERILSSVELQYNSKSSDEISLSKGKIYYSFKACERNESNRLYFILLVTDKNMVDGFLNDVVLQTNIIFVVVTLSSMAVLALWGGSYVSRINRLKLHLNELKEHNYDSEYLDDGSDELADLSRSVENLKNQIKKNEQTKQEMLQNLSHDFKTPIAVIKSYAEAISDGMASADDAKIITKQATLLKKKVGMLLEYNRLEYLEKKDDFEEVLMAEVISDVVDSYKFQSPNLKFELHLDDTKFLGYQENFSTVVENLIDNASRYAKSSIKIDLENGELKIYNDGKHIAEQFVRDGFKAYEKGSDGQFGLGMSIVIKTLDFFDYELIVENKEVGVMFTIRPKKHLLIHLQ